MKKIIAITIATGIACAVLAVFLTSRYYETVIMPQLVLSEVHTESKAPPAAGVVTAGSIVNCAVPDLLDNQPELVSAWANGPMEAVLTKDVVDATGVTVIPAGSTLYAQKTDTVLLEDNRIQIAWHTLELKDSHHLITLALNDDSPLPYSKMVTTLDTDADQLITSKRPLLAVTTGDITR